MTWEMPVIKLTCKTIQWFLYDIDINTPTNHANYPITLWFNYHSKASVALRKFLDICLIFSIRRFENWLTCQTCCGTWLAKLWNEQCFRLHKFRLYHRSFTFNLTSSYTLNSTAVSNDTVNYTWHFNACIFHSFIQQRPLTS